MQVSDKLKYVDMSDLKHRMKSEANSYEERLGLLKKEGQYQETSNTE